MSCLSSSSVNLGRLGVSNASFSLVASWSLSNIDMFLGETLFVSVVAALVCW